jgi:hypothetical protein
MVLSIFEYVYTDGFCQMVSGASKQLKVEKTSVQ